MSALEIISKEEEKELDTITFHRKQIMFKPQESDLLTLEDSDEQKLPALNKLLKFIHGFRQEMISVDIHPKAEKEGGRKNLYLLTDTEYENFEPFEIRIMCNWFDPGWKFMLHAGFDFSLSVNQDAYEGRGEIADWIKIHIKHLNTVPSSFASQREHVRALTPPFIEKTASWFNDIPMDFTGSVNYGRMAHAMSFKTALFNQSVDDACTVMLKIAARKEMLKTIEEKQLQ